MKKRMAKIMSAVLVSAMAVSMMAGCGSDKKKPQVPVPVRKVQAQ